MTDVNPKLGSRLRELRGEESLYKVGKRAGVPRNNLLRYEEGQHLPTEAVLRKLAEYYGVAYAELRILYYDDWLQRQQPEERAIIIEWAKSLSNL